MSVTGSSGSLTESGKQDQVLVFYADIHKHLFSEDWVDLSTAVFQSYVVIVDFNKIHIHWKLSLIHIDISSLHIFCTR